MGVERKVLRQTKTDVCWERGVPRWHYSPLLTLVNQRRLSSTLGSLGVPSYVRVLRSAIVGPSVQRQHEGDVWGWHCLCTCAWMSRDVVVLYVFVVWAFVYTSVCIFVNDSLCDTGVPVPLWVEDGTVCRGWHCVKDGTVCGG